MIKPINEMKLSIPSASSNESFARVAVGAFVSQLDPTVEELADIKTAVSEAVTNCTVHAYPESIGTVYIYAAIFADRTILIRVRDKGCGIGDVQTAMQPMWSSLGGERAGLGFAVMQSFTDSVKVRSKVGGGTTVTMKKRLLSKVRA